MNDTTQEPRTCQQCGGPIPAHKIARAKYCHSNCSRVATYHRKSTEARAEINKRSNDRRMKQDLLPILRSISHIPDYGLTPGSDVAKFAVGCFLVERMAKWKLHHALNFAHARNTLATLAGGHDELEELEELITTEVLKVMDKSQ